MKIRALKPVDDVRPVALKIYFSFFCLHFFGFHSSIGYRRAAGKHIFDRGRGSAIPRCNAQRTELSSRPNEQQPLACDYAKGVAGSEQSRIGFQPVPGTGDSKRRVFVHEQQRWTVSKGSLVACKTQAGSLCYIAPVVVWAKTHSLTALT